MVSVQVAHAVPWLVITALWVYSMLTNGMPIEGAISDYLLTPNQQQAICAYPDVSFYSSQTGSTKCYRLFTSKFDWPHAKVACGVWGGDLVTINSADENNWIAHVLLPSARENKKTWIGVHSYETFLNGATTIGRKLPSTAADPSYFSPTGSHVPGEQLNLPVGYVPNLQYREQVNLADHKFPYLPKPQEYLPHSHADGYDHGNSPANSFPVGIDPKAPLYDQFRSPNGQYMPLPPNWPGISAGNYPATGYYPNSADLPPYAGKPAYAHNTLGGDTSSTSVQNIWLPSQSSSYPLHCAYVSSEPHTSGRWFSQDCYSAYSFVCEKPYIGANEQGPIYTTTDLPMTTTCSPFGTSPSCDARGLGSGYGTTIQDRGVCLLLYGVDETEPLSWLDAKRKCIGLTGSLVKIEDATRLQIVNNFAAIAEIRSRAKGVWTGLRSSQHFYRWPDGQKLSYVPSHSVLPAPVDLCYAFANFTGDYNATYCDDPSVIMPFICEVSACPLGMYAVPDCNKNDYLCVEEDECTNGKANCGTNSAGLCVDKPHDEGRFECHCQNGFQQWGGIGDFRATCVDIPECDDPNTCSQLLHGGLCIEQNGGYLCACRNGFRLSNGTAMDSSAQACIEVDECKEQPGVCGQGTCSNIPGSYDCVCNPGYQFLNGRCSDINECALAIYPCGIPTAQAFCNNQLGYAEAWPKGFTCDCPYGFMFILPDSVCVQINNCKADSSGNEPLCGSDPNAQCVSYQQKHYCACGGGQNFNGKWCEPINLIPLTYTNGTLALTAPYYVNRY